MRLHLGAAECLASVSLLQREELRPGETALAQVFLSAPAVATWGQAFVIRSESPVATIGGGMVLDPTATKIRRGETAKQQRLAQLASDDPLARAAASAYLAGLQGCRAEDLSRAAGIEDPPGVIDTLREQGELTPLTLTPTRSLLISRDALEDAYTQLEAALARLHERFPLQVAIDASRVLNRFRYLGDETLVEAVLDSLCQTGRVRRSPGGLTLKDHGPQLSRHEQTLLEEIVSRYFEAGFEPPTVDEVQASATRNRASVPGIIAVATAEGRLTRVSESLCLHRDHERRLRETLSEQLRGGEGLTVSEIRKLLGVSRKYAVPFCEHLDSIGFTRRVGDKRVLAE